MSDARSPDETTPATPAFGDRRRPASRYVEFRDLPAHQRCSTAAERSYRALAASDGFGAPGRIEVPPSDGSAGTSRFRWGRRPAAQLVEVTPALARVDQLTREALRETVESPNACPASSQVARLLAGVTSELVRDLAVLPPDEQGTHPAYRQTLRLAAELDGVRDTVTGLGCTASGSCVGIRPPDRLDRRVEDAEVAEVRSVLNQLARASDAEHART